MPAPLACVRGHPDELVEEALAQRGVLSTLGVPLHPHIEPAIRVVDGFDDVVVGGRDDAERPGVGDGLSVLAGDQTGGEGDG
jgi:hypothetical protein